MTGQDDADQAITHLLPPDWEWDAYAIVTRTVSPTMGFDVRVAGDTTDMLTLLLALWRVIWERTEPADRATLRIGMHVALDVMDPDDPPPRGPLVQ